MRRFTNPRCAWTTCLTMALAAIMLSGASCTGSPRTRVQGPDPPPASREPADAARSSGPAAPRRSQPADTGQDRQDLASLLERAGQYVEGYLEDLSSIVAEETYDQEVVDGSRKVFNRKTRRLRSDYLLVRMPGQAGVTPFRDVYEVDGRAVRDRDDRLVNLFGDGRPGALATARRVLDEGARYNIGRVQRNINQPVLPLLFLLPGAQRGFRFVGGDEELIDAARVRRVDFTETRRPTTITRSGSGEDMPSSGSFWLEPGTGRVLLTLIRTGDRVFSMEATVTYRHNTALGLHTPVEMRESYTVGRERITGSATYRDFRRFGVTTEEIFRVPDR